MDSGCKERQRECLKAGRERACQVLQLSLLELGQLPNFRTTNNCRELLVLVFLTSVKLKSRLVVYAGRSVVRRCRVRRGALLVFEVNVMDTTTYTSCPQYNCERQVIK